MLNRLKINGIVIFKYCLSIWGTISTIVSLILAFVSWNEIGITDFWYKILVLIGIGFFSLVLSVLIVIFKNSKKIFGDKDKGLSVEYGDIIESAFDNCGKSKKIIVIPVNRCFDLSCENNLISEKSIHGKWLKKFIPSEKERNELHKKIEVILTEKQQEYIFLNKKQKKVGYSKQYETGAIVELSESNDIIFYLWAISEFDDNLCANCSEVDYFNALQKLIDYYDKNGQCVDMYCPIVGDHIIRPTKPTEDALHFMISMFKINKSKIHGNIHIVVYNQKKADISILKY